VTDALSAICDTLSGIWTVGRIVNHQAIPLSKQEIEELVGFWNEKQSEAGMERMGFLQMNPHEQLATKWERAADQYAKQVAESVAKQLPHDQMLSMMTALRGCAKELRDEIKKEAK
jgi:threonine aldolase